MICSYREYTGFVFLQTKLGEAVMSSRGGYSGLTILTKVLWEHVQRRIATNRYNTANELYKNASTSWQNALRAEDEAVNPRDIANT
eukprot:5772344-Amphidinium_carterae.1